MYEHGCTKVASLRSEVALALLSNAAIATSRALPTQLDLFTAAGGGGAIGGIVGGAIAWALNEDPSQGGVLGGLIGMIVGVLLAIFEASGLYS